MMFKFLVLGVILSVQLSGLQGQLIDPEEYPGRFYDNDGNEDGGDQDEWASEYPGKYAPRWSAILQPRHEIAEPTTDSPPEMRWRFLSDMEQQESTTDIMPTESGSVAEESSEPSELSKPSEPSELSEPIEPREPIVIPVHKAQPELSNSMRVVGKMLSSEYLVTKGIGAHKLHLRRLSWNKARKVCIDEGGQLADIRSDSEEKIVLRMLNEESVEFAWVGYHDLFEEGDWVSVLGEPFGKSGWDRWWKVRLPNPDNSGPTDNEDCACLMRDGGGLNDNACEKELPFVCKITAL